jgi:N utilization substance protein A
LAKKAEGRPVTPEEYQVMAQFVDRIERGIIRRRHTIKTEADERYKQVRESIPEKAFSIFLEDLPFSPRIYNVLSEAGFDSLGNLMLQMELDSDEILKLSGMGPKALDEIKSIIASVKFPVVEEEPILAPVIEEEEPVALMQPKEQVLEEAPIPVDLTPSVEVALASTEAAEAVTEPFLEPASTTAVSEGGETGVVPIVSGDGDELLEEEPTLDSLFTLRPEAFTAIDAEEEEEGEDETGSPKKGKKAKKKKRRFTEVEYDPDRDVMLVKHKSKRGPGWEDNWEP